VLLPDGMNVNHALVKDSWRWWYRKYALGDTVLEWLEKDAREAKKDLWVNPAHVPPWEWRKRNRYNERKIALLYDRFFWFESQRLTTSHNRQNLQNVFQPLAACLVVRGTVFKTFLMVESEEVDFSSALPYPSGVSKTNIFEACEFPDHIEIRTFNGSRS
jgi:hypothetical protein